MEPFPEVKPSRWGLVHPKRHFCGLKKSLRNLKTHLISIGYVVVGASNLAQSLQGKKGNFERFSVFSSICFLKNYFSWPFQIERAKFFFRSCDVQPSRAIRGLKPKILGKLWLAGERTPKN
jgi:hypothetical protein